MEKDPRPTNSKKAVRKAKRANSVEENKKGSSKINLSKLSSLVFPNPKVKKFLLEKLNEAQRSAYAKYGGFDFEDPPSPDFECMPLREYENGGFYFGQVQPGTNIVYGQGIYWHEGYFYEGYWQDDTQNGEGKLILDDGEIKIGTFKDGCLSGSVTSIWPDGRRYVGNLKHYQLHGHGEVFFPDGGKLEGRFLQGKMDGWGKTTKANGDTSQGEWLDGYPHGCFIIDSDTEQFYWTGQTKFGQMYGKGVKGTPESVVTGMSKHDNSTGLTLVCWKEPGVTHIGSWKDGNRHGIVYTKEADGTIRKELWNNGDFVKELKC